MRDGETIRPDLTPKEFELFRDLIGEQSGIELDGSQIDSLRISLSARTGGGHFRDYLDYYRFLKQDPQGEEFKELLSLITTNETYFFRMPAHFAALRDHVLPEIVERKKDNKINIWSAGCSAGEEPYSIAITLCEYFKDIGHWDICILGTDVSKRALAAAEEAVYKGRTLRLVDPEYLSNYFEHLDKENYRPKEEIRSMVSFGYHNLIKEPFPLRVMSGWDIIFCRNVLIYFSQQSAKRVINNFYESLEEDGYLFVGYAEMLQTICDKFLPCEIGKAFVYRKSGEKEKAQTPELKSTVSSPRLLPLYVEAPAEEVNPPETEEDALQKAEVFIEEEEYRLALAALERSLAGNPWNTDALLLRGLVSANLKNYRQAEEDCLKVIRINRMVAPAHFLLGVIYQNQGKNEKAVEEFRKTVYLDSDFALAYLNIANIYRQLERNDDALRELRNAAAAARRAPQGEWLKYAGGFLTEAVVDTAEKLAGKLEASKVR